MSIEQGERRVPPPPVVPPRPAAPPRPFEPPKPSTPPTVGVPVPDPDPGEADAPGNAGQADGGDRVADDEGESSPPTLLLRAVTVPAPTTSPRHHLTTRLVTPVVCLVLGAGLLSGAAAGAWLTGDGGDPTSAAAVYDAGRSLWRDVPVNVLFPAELTGEGAGPGGADRRWLRVGVAPDGGCQEAFDPLLAEVLATVGCHRLVRATYVDETETSVTTVGLLFTETTESGMRQLRERFRAEGLAERPDLMPRAYAPAGTVAEGYGNAQRFSWTVRVLTGIPVMVYAVTGFVDGRVATDPQPADEATVEGQGTTVALAGLGHDAEGIADRVRTGLRRAAGDTGDTGAADDGEPR